MDFDFLYKDYSRNEGRDPVPKMGEEITRRAEDGQIKMVTLYKRNRSARTHRRIMHYTRMLACPKCRRSVQELVDVPNDTPGEIRVWCRWCRTNVRIPLALENSIG